MLTALQADDVRRIRDEGRRLVCNDMGTGKTRVGLRAADTPFLIVCPKAVVSHWVRECADELGWSPIILSGRTPWPLGRGGSYIINYDVLRAWAAGLDGFGTVILDEGHRLGNPATAIFAAVRAVGCRNRIILTGTPVLNNAMELFTLAHLISPSRFPRFSDFAMVRGWTGMLRPRTMDEIRAELDATILLRRCLETAKPIKTVELFETTDVVFWLKQWMKSNPGKKILVFGHHHRILQPLAKTFSTESVLIDGTIVGRARDTAFARWRSTIPILFMNLIIGGFGWDATCSDTILFVELPWHSAGYDQAIGRLNRPGQKSNQINVFVIPEKRHQEIIKVKRNIFERLFS